MINNVVLVGRLTKDPELTYTPSGVAKARFTVAVTRSFSGQNGERETDFVNCIAWRKQAENLANYQRKGNLIGVEGRIQTGKFDGQDGKAVFTTDVIAEGIQFLEPKSRNEQPGQNQPPAPPQGQQYQGYPPSYQSAPQPHKNPPQQQGGYQGQQGDPFNRQW